MTLLTPDLAPIFWDELGSQGVTPEDIESGRVSDLGRRLCDFMEVHAPKTDMVVEMPVQQSVDELSQAS